MLPLARALMEVRDVLWGRDGAWLEEPTSLVLFYLSVGVVVTKTKSKNWTEKFEEENEEIKKKEEE